MEPGIRTTVQYKKIKRPLSDPLRSLDIIVLQCDTQNEIRLSLSRLSQIIPSSYLSSRSPYRKYTDRPIFDILLLSTSGRSRERESASFEKSPVSRLVPNFKNGAKRDPLFAPPTRLPDNCRRRRRLSPALHRNFGIGSIVAARFSSRRFSFFEIPFVQFRPKSYRGDGTYQCGDPIRRCGVGGMGGGCHDVTVVVDVVVVGDDDASR
mmetsp:Transcript_11923/g.21509  ORF Transcript_11923/g.21509 Transcript_11923/m.21509 type:complete len:208 (+) Transcript_11923:1094-1717(+)